MGLASFGPYFSTSPSKSPQASASFARSASVMSRFAIEVAKEQLLQGLAQLGMAAAQPFK